MPRRAETRAHEGRRRVARRVLTHPLFLAAVLLGGFALTVTWTRVASTSDFCATCHETDGVVETAAASVHADVACIDCHGDSSASGALRYIPSLVLETVEQATGLHVPLANVGTDSCTSCHEPDAWASAAAGEAATGKNAGAHPGSKSECVLCHGEVAHPGLKGEKPQKRAPGDDHPEDWQALHGRELAAQGDDACAACHRPEVFCRSCHASQNPIQHRSDWWQTHGDAVTAQGATACTSCHSPKTFCESCHGTEIPHAETWLRSHSRAVEEVGQKPCEGCHAPRDCTVCHDRHDVHAEQRLSLGPPSREAA